MKWPPPAVLLIYLSSPSARREWIEMKSISSLPFVISSLPAEGERIEIGDAQDK